MCEGNPGEIDFGSSWREVRVSKGSSYRYLISGPKSYRDFRETDPRAFPALENRSGEGGGKFSNEKALGTRLVFGSYYL